MQTLSKIIFHNIFIFYYYITLYNIQYIINNS
jgi:hypothetical protein